MGAGYPLDMALTPDDLDGDTADALTTQSYGGSDVIDGVVIVDVTHHVDDSGGLVELGRLVGGQLADFAGFEVRQINWSQVLPGAIKAWHLHLDQDDVWFVPPQGRLLAGLRDCRQGSASHGVVMRRVLGAGRAQLVRVPRGVAHGVANPWMTASDLIYLVDRPFDPVDPDERRLPWDHFGAAFWALRRG